MSENLLSKSNSLYLLQHAHNPVNWYPWCKQAFEQAKIQNKPILLSIGYSACHWCHVMAHESFEDSNTAKLMNDLFISIKVDKEERPDLDQIYQLSLQLLIRQPGGWPLTLFCDPEDRIPFFGGTYFPLARRYNLASFKEILQEVAKYYIENRPAIRHQNQELKKALDSFSISPAHPHEINLEDKKIFNHATEVILSEYDDVQGGFGHAPKFPPHQYLLFLSDKEKINYTLNKMSNGGIMDQVGGGFFRYAVDHRWEIPHFEKMLYDNGQLLTRYTLANQKETALLITEWVMREMESPEGGYYASLDADTEGKEGKYYYWDRDEIKKLLTSDEFKLMTTYFNINHSPNFEGHWHLYKVNAIEEKDKNKFEIIRLKLLKARETRTYPACNKKIIISWNGLMIKGMLTAGKKFNNTLLIDSAERAINYCYSHLNTENLFLDDYAFLLNGIIEVIDRHRDFAIQLADTLCNNFYDEENGGFYFTSHSHEKLITRLKPLVDNVTPSGNGMAVLALIKLGRLLNHKRYLDVCKKTLKFAWPNIEKNPYLYTTLLLSAAELATMPV